VMDSRCRVPLVVRKKHVKADSQTEVDGSIVSWKPMGAERELEI